MVSSDESMHILPLSDSVVFWGAAACFLVTQPPKINILKSVLIETLFAQ